MDRCSSEPALGAWVSPGAGAASGVPVMLLQTAREPSSHRGGRLRLVHPLVSSAADVGVGTLVAPTSGVVGDWRAAAIWAVISDRRLGSPVWNRERGRNDDRPFETMGLGLSAPSPL
jgi:hypothetical protein